MILQTTVQCVQPNGHGVSGEHLVLSYDTEKETSTLSIFRHEREFHVSLPILQRELARLVAAGTAAKAVTA